MDPHLHHRRNDEPLADELVSAYLDGELTADEQAQIEERMAASPEFRQTVEELRGLRTSFEALPQHRLPADFAERVLRRAEQEVLIGTTNAATATPASVTLPARPATEDRLPTRRSGFRPFVWTMVAAAAALLILITNRQPNVREVPIAKSPEAEREALQTTESASETSTTGKPAPPAENKFAESGRADQLRAGAAGEKSAAVPSEETVRDLANSDKREKGIEEKMPALSDTIPAPNDVLDRVAPAPESVRTRSRLSTAGDDVSEGDKTGRAVELRLPAPTDEPRKDVRDAPADKESIAKEPLDKKAAIADGDSAGSAAAPSNAPAPTNARSRDIDAATLPGITAGVDLREKLNDEAKRGLDRSESAEALQEEQSRFGEQLGQLGAAAPTDDLMVVQVTLTPEAAQSGAFDAVLAKNSIQVEGSQSQRAASRETLLGAPAAAAGPVTANDREEFERTGQSANPQLPDTAAGRAVKSELTPENRTRRAQSADGKPGNAPQSASRASRSAPADPRSEINERGRAVRQQQFGRDLQTTPPSLARNKDPAAAKSEGRELDADVKLKADATTMEFGDAERAVAKSDVFDSIDLNVVVVTASADQINGTLAALVTQKALFPSVQVAIGFNLPTVNFHQAPVEGKAIGGVGGSSYGGFGAGGGGRPNSGLPLPRASGERLPSATPSQNIPSTDDNKRENAKPEAAQSFDVQKKEDLAKTTSGAKDAPPRSAGGGETGSAASGATKYLPGARKQSERGEAPSANRGGIEGKKELFQQSGVEDRAEPPSSPGSRDLRSQGSADSAGAAGPSASGYARRMRLESVAEVLRVQAGQQVQASDERVSGTLPASQPPAVEKEVEAGATAAKPLGSSGPKKSIAQSGKDRDSLDTTGRAKPYFERGSANEQNQPAEPIPSSTTTPDRVLSDLESSINQRGGFQSPQSRFVAPRPTGEKQTQRRVLFVFRLAESAIAGQAGGRAGTESASGALETARRRGRNFSGARPRRSSPFPPR